jgi:adenylate kinase family enzyme
MQRIIIIGSGGAGKSTLAKILGQRLSIPVIHLDALYWQPNWQPTSETEWINIQQKLRQNACWIMDGNYGGTLDLRIEAADTIIFLDFKRSLCLWRVIKRYFRYRGRTRPDMGSSCPEKLDWEFLQWIWTFPKRRRHNLLSKLETYQNLKRVIILQNPKQVSDFLAQLAAIAAIKPQ